jgi:hypothetical protein
MQSGVYFPSMSPPIDNHIDWIVPATPTDARTGKSLPRLPAKPVLRKPPDTSLGVMDTLLGQNSLAALEEGGRDPYNATGRQFRR